jgi:N-acetylmuramoyl-L-alanine amidase
MGLKGLSAVLGLGIAASVSALVVLSPSTKLWNSAKPTAATASTGSASGGLAKLAKPQPLVIIDPGHGAEDPGARSVFGTAEKDITWQISSLISQDLQQLGVRVKMTRAQDGNPSLSDRLSYGLTGHPAFFLSVHANSFDGSPDIRGAEIHVYDPAKFSESRYPGTKISKAKAQQSVNISESIVHEMTQHTVGIPVRAGEPKGIRYDVDFVCRLNDCAAGLIELGYLSNPTDAKLLTDAKVQATYAKDIAIGIANKVLPDGTALH